MKDEKRSYKAKNIVIATGSSPTSLPGIEIDEKNIVSSTGALSFLKFLKIYCYWWWLYRLEMGSVWSRLGSNVTVVEYLDFITPGMDREVSNEFKKILTKQGIQFKLNNKVTAVTNIKNKVVVDYTNNTTAARERIECDKVLVSVGRKPYTEGLNLSKLELKKMTKEELKLMKNYKHH